MVVFDMVTDFCQLFTIVPYPSPLPYCKAFVNRNGIGGRIKGKFAVSASFDHFTFYVARHFICRSLPLILHRYKQGK